MQVDFTILVPQFACFEKEKRSARSQNVSIKEAEERPGYCDLDWLSFPTRDLAIDIIVGHGAKFGKQAQVIRESHNCNNRTKVDNVYSSYLRSSEKHQDITQLTPSSFGEFSDVKQAAKEMDQFKVLTFGRGDLEDFSLKSYDISAKAIAELSDRSFCLIFLGASEESHVVESEQPKEWAKAIAGVRQMKRSDRLGEIQQLRAAYEEKFTWERLYNILLDKMRELVYATTKLNNALTRTIWPFRRRLHDETDLFDFVHGHQSWDDYLGHIKQDGAWGDHVILIAAVNYYKISIRVVSCLPRVHDVIIKPQCPVEKSETLVLGHIHELHYVSLRPIKVSVPRISTIKLMQKKRKEEKSLEVEDVTSRSTDQDDDKMNEQETVIRSDQSIARHVYASTVLCTLIDNGKLANQIATFPVPKMERETWNLAEAGASITFNLGTITKSLALTCLLWRRGALSPPIGTNELLVSNVIELSHDGPPDLEFKKNAPGGVNVALLHSASNLKGYEAVIKQLVDAENNEWNDLETKNIWQTSVNPTVLDWMFPFAKATCRKTWFSSFAEPFRLTVRVSIGDRSNLQVKFLKWLGGKERKKSVLICRPVTIIPNKQTNKAETRKLNSEQPRTNPVSSKVEDLNTELSAPIPL
ncbi:OTU domain-containing protein [Stylophora pistillata]|uniref:OTU domain-containing protein n=1 Tax=Stylophora pistillata TaxID=50429 RepID=A0A2B4REV9_STYPI|nr:OTU domain-containing protein [Stylophora pistillata]